MEPATREMLTTILISGASGAMVAAVLWKVLVARSLEELRKQLSERLTLFKMYHEKRMEAHSTIYDLLDYTVERVTDIVSPLQIGGEASVAMQQQEAVGSYNKLVTYFRGRKIFLDQDLCDLIDEVIDTTHKAISDHLLAEEFEGDDAAEARRRAWENMSEKVPEVRDRLLVALRKSLRAGMEER